MTENKEIKITKMQVENAIEKIPESDFVDQQFDVNYSQNLKGIFFLLSTPRSGSTMICDLLYKSDFCLAHEYFQPYQYLPILANRWGCLKEDLLDKEMFTKQLIRFRTLKSGWLGINLHGHHLPIYYKFKEYFPDSEKIFVRVRRRNVIAQAISYEIASQTGKWSSEFQTGVTPVYSFDNIKSKINAIKQQEILTDIFATSLSENVIELVYEDFILDPIAALSSIIPEEPLKTLLIEPSLKKQSSNLNKAWIDRFTQEFIETDGKGIPINKQKQTLLVRIAKKIFSL